MLLTTTTSTGTSTTLLTTDYYYYYRQARGRWSNAEQEVVDRVIRQKLQRDYGGLSLESDDFRQFLTALGESTVGAGGKKRKGKDRADTGDFGDESD